MLRRTFVPRQRPHGSLSPRSSRGLSVIIAGATGNTGSELVTRLVSHKNVTRVVALTRRDVGVDRWQHYFPNIRTTDALKFLSVVAVDWDRIRHDASLIPAAALCTRPLLAEGRSDSLRKVLAMEQNAARRREAEHAKNCNNASFASHRSGAVSDVDVSSSAPQQHGRSRRTRGGSVEEGADANTIDLVGGALAGGEEASPSSSTSTLSFGGLTFRSRAQRMGKAERLRQAKAARGRAGVAQLGASHDNAMGGEESHHDAIDVGSEHLITLAERSAIIGIANDPYYRSVFADHTVAINCLGTHRVLIGGALTTVDLEYSLAFAKIVRLFNSVAIDDAYLQDITASAAEDSLRAYGSRRSMAREGGTEWAEIRSACFGPMVNISFGGGGGGVVGAGAGQATPPVPGDGGSASVDPSAPNGTASSSSSPSIHLASDALQRRRAYEARRADAAQLRHWDAAVRAALKGRRHSTHTLHHFVQVSTAGASESAPLPYFRVHGECDRRVLALFDFDESAGGGVSVGGAEGSGTADSCRGSGGDSGAEDVISLLPPRPRQSASRPAEHVYSIPLLPSSSVLAPTLNHRADVTIFRPGLLRRRRNVTMLERFLSYWARPLATGELADVIIDDVMARQSIAEEGAAALADLQAALNRKHKYKMWVSRDVFGATTATSPYAPASSSPSATAAADGGANWDETLLRSHGVGEAHSFYGGGYASAPAAAAASAPVSAPVPPAVSRARLMAMAAQETAEIKARLGVSKADLDRMAEGAGGVNIAVRGGGGGGHGGGGLSASAFVTSLRTDAAAPCAVCDLRERLGMDPSATIVGAGDIKRRHDRLMGRGPSEGEERRGESAKASSPRKASSASSVGAASTSSSWAALFTAEPHEGLCHQR